MAIEIPGAKTKETVKPAMNITPLVDIVLVLLIIFMTVAPTLVKQFFVQLPATKKEQNQASPDDQSKPVVLKVKKDGSLELSGSPVERAALRVKLARVLAAKNGDHTVFFVADDLAPYGAAVEAMDLARAGGAAPLTVLTEKPKS
ncbi:MAG: biopolymer transporter ExbD [Deltaproteobacteria bacterium]|nr:biopolymer transporter ExbD [Deltaproteobacteria bacterium]